MWPGGCSPWSLNDGVEDPPGFPRLMFNIFISDPTILNYIAHIDREKRVNII